MNCEKRIVLYEIFLKDQKSLEKFVHVFQKISISYQFICKLSVWNLSGLTRKDNKGHGRTRKDREGQRNAKKGNEGRNIKEC